MSEKEIKLIYEGYPVAVYTVQTAIVGSGCAAYNAADSLWGLGVRDIAIITEGMEMGTSRNTGSDKQTYYKLSLSSSVPDSVYQMAKTLFEGQCVHGDMALVEAALSARCFFKLVNLGVPFPHDAYGQYVGYKTDHDPMQRATSCGPLTSRYMTEHLEREVLDQNIPVFDGYRVIELLAREHDGDRQVVGMAAISKKETENPHGLAMFCCKNIIYATGGPSGIYHNSVYPKSQTCAHGAAFRCGAYGNNVTEWQYGIASTSFRWNLSGTYQQVIPRYVSARADGTDEREFLMDYFSSPGKMLSAVFLKGYEWPFDPRKLGEGGSSLIDIAVYMETIVKGRRVYLDYRRNPEVSLKDGTFDFSLLSAEAAEYLKQSGILFGTPVERLKKMNRPAYELYLGHGIDLERDLLEISVCSQHNNGGLKADIWWQSNVKGLFPVGEACGNFGVYRPGGSALNAGQVGSLRAAQYIAGRSAGRPVEQAEFEQEAYPALDQIWKECEALKKEKENGRKPLILREIYQKEMDQCAAFIRKKEGISEQVRRCRNYLEEASSVTEVHTIEELVDAWINKDILTTQSVYLYAMEQYEKAGGKSRGSYLIDDGTISYEMCQTDGVKVELDHGAMAGVAQEVFMEAGDIVVKQTPVRPIPDAQAWFETVYNRFLNDEIIGTE